MAPETDELKDGSQTDGTAPPGPEQRRGWWDAQKAFYAVIATYSPGRSDPHQAALETVFFRLVCYSDDAGNAFPSLSTLQKELHYGESTIRNALERLADLKVITQHRRGGGGAGKGRGARPTRYVIAEQFRFKGLSNNQNTQCYDLDTTKTPSVTRPKPPVLHRELRMNTRPVNTQRAMREHAREEFARLWEVWPNQTERRDSEREYIKARTAKNSTMPPIDDLLGIAREHVRRGVKEALKWWIRGARWEDKFPDDTAPGKPADPAKKEEIDRVLERLKKEEIPE